MAVTPDSTVVIDWQDPRWAGLPVVAELDVLQAAIANHQVVVVAGETGSGKTTQLPKICLSLGLGQTGLIGHTQPRRLAAKQVAARIADELGSHLGGLVGYKVRFDDKSSSDNVIRLMTDGMLLAEIQQDRLLKRYQVLIIDEAHERSLNIDFLLGFLKQLLPKRPDLKVIITSATIDHDRFAAFYNAAVVEVSGRSYPVDMLYRPGDDDSDTAQQILASVEEIESLERANRAAKRLDILVFLPGERDIRDAHLQLKKAELFATDVLPLYARLNAKEQARVFQSHRGRRIILATNVAETSLTVPNVGYVIDTGTARISRYSVASKVQRLPIEAISQASANQRAGRAGRLMPGVCFRLYDQQDFLSRPEFTEPEIQRTNLASVILTMANLRLGEIEKFPFINPPEGRLVRDGRRLLYELGALDSRQRLTKLGRQLARFPLDPRLSRMLFSANERGVLSETLIIVAALAVQNPCERPPDKQQQADQAHWPFTDKRSDFLFYWKLWQWAEQQRSDLSRGQYSKLLKRTFLSPRRMHEWRDIHRQLLTQVRQLGWTLSKQPPQNIEADIKIDYEAVHRSLLSGLSTLVMHRTDEGEWESCRNRKPLVWPGSALRKNKGSWLMAAEQVETSRLFGRTLAQIKPEWVIESVPHLLKFNYSEPHWSKRREDTLAYESVMLFGLLLTAGKRVSYQKFDQTLAREFMIRDGLVDAQLKRPIDFVEINRQTLSRLEVIEHKMRRRDYLVDEEAQAAFYEQAIPANIYSIAALRRWYKTADKASREQLLMSEDFLLARDANQGQGGFPDNLEVDGISLPLSYHFDPAGERDGITLDLPQSLLEVFPRWRSEWLVPGLLTEKIAALLRALPKAKRRQVVPVPDYANALANRLIPNEPLLPALTRELEAMVGLRIEQEKWPLEKLPDWLRMNIRLLDNNGDSIKESRQWGDFDGLEVAADNAVAEKQICSTGDWCFDAIAEHTQQQLAGTTMSRYPALSAQGKQVCLVSFATEAQANYNHARGLAKLTYLARPDIIKPLKKRAAALAGFQKLQPEKSQFARTALELTLLYVLRAHLHLDQQVIRTESQWKDCLVKGLGDAIPACEADLVAFSNIYQRYRTIRVKLAKNFPLSHAFVHADISTQLDDLFHPQALLDWPQDWWQQMPRYLAAIERRLEQLNKEDRAIVAKLDGYRAQYLARAADNPFWQQPPELQQYRLMLEELRVSLFAQQLGTQMPVSFKRLNKQWLNC